MSSEEPVPIAWAHRLHLDPGDTVVVSSPHPLTAEEAETLHAQISEFFEDHPVLVLATGLQVYPQRGSLWQRLRARNL
jgi:hypothetical protein